MPATPSVLTMFLLRILPAIAWMGLIYVLSDQSKLPTVASISSQITSVVGHLGAWFVLAVLLWWALGLLPVADRPRYLLAFILAVLYGISDEWHQSFVPGRHPDVLDVLTDAIGAGAGLLVVARLGRSTLIPDQWRGDDAPQARRIHGSGHPRAACRHR